MEVPRRRIGGGRPLGSIFEVGPDQRAKLGSGTVEEAHFRLEPRAFKRNGEHRNGARSVMWGLLGYAR
jgi:hypothetical protein